MTQIHFICLSILFFFAFLIFFLDVLEVKDSLFTSLEVDLEIQNRVLESKDDELKNLERAETERLEKTLTDKETTAMRQNLLLFGVVLYIITRTVVQVTYYPG